MSSKKKTVLLMSLITLLAFVFVAPAAMAVDFGVTFDASSADISAASGIQVSRGGSFIIYVKFDQVVTSSAASAAVPGEEFAVGDLTLTAFNSSGGVVASPIPAIGSLGDGRNFTITIYIPAGSPIAELSVLLPQGTVGAADPTVGDADDANERESVRVEVLSGNPPASPTVYEISRVGLAVAITTAAEFQVKLLLSEAPSGGCTPGLINVTGADVRSIQALTPTPATVSRPATWRDGMLHGCAVTLATRPGQNTVVIRVNSFSGLGGQTYTPPTNPIESVHVLTVGSQRTELAGTAGIAVDLPAGKRILDYFVVATNIAGSGIQRPNDSDASPPSPTRPPAQLKYNIIEVSLPNLETFLRAGGRIDLVSSDLLSISEIMWGSDTRLGAPQNSQWIEIKNNSGRHIVTGVNTHRLIFYGANETPPASRAGIADRVGTLNAAGAYWSLEGKGQGAGPRGTQPITSMYRVSGLDGTLPAAWMQSTRPTLNFDVNRVGNYIGSPGADTLGAPAQPPPTTTPGTPPSTTPRTPATIPETVAGPPDSLVIIGGAERTAETVNQQLESPLVVQVLDLDENGIPNTRVIFRVTAGKGKLGERRAGLGLAVETDAGGYARADFTPTSEGTLTVQATTTGLDQTVEFTIQTAETPPATPETPPATTQGTTPQTTPKTTPAGPGDPPPRTTVNPVVHVGASKRLPMVWVDGGKIYGLIGADVKVFIAGVDNAMSVAVGDEKVYWTAQVSETRGTLNSANLDGTGAKELRDEPLWGVPIGIAVDTDSSKLYWTDAVGRLQRSGLDGSGIRNVLRDLTDPMDIALSDGKAYWTQGNGSVRFVNLTGQKTIENISRDAESAGSLVITDEKVYWTEKTGENTGTVNSANLDGTGAKQLIAIDAVPMGIAVDIERSSLYWTDDTGRIQSANLDGSVIQDVIDGLVRPGDMVLNASLTTPKKTSPPPTPTSTDKYDFNDDGTVDDKDAKLLTDAISAGSTDAKYDVNDDGEVNFDDLQLVLDNRDRSPYDINGDGTVDDKDASLLTKAISNDSTDAKYDVNNDGKVNFDDLQLVLDNRAQGTAGAPLIGGNLKLTAAQMARLQEQIDLLIATGDRSPAAMRTLIYLQQLLAMACPEKTQLLANYPNPFNPETWIPYELATDTDVRITIYNAQGVVIRTLQLGQQSAGYYTDRERAAYWDGRNALGEQVASGVYFYQLQTDTLSTLRKMVILK